MQSSTDFLSDAAFFQEAADFLDMNCFTPTSSLFNCVHESESSAIPEISESTSRDRSTDINSDIDERDSAVIALRNHRDKEKLRRRKQRQRVKDELESLRRKDGELTQQLKKLKLRKEGRIGRGEQHSIWKEVARMQREERLKSETEQRKLTSTMKVQASYIENLRGLLRQNSAACNNTLQGAVVNGTIDTNTGDSDLSMFTSLLQKIDSCFTRFDDILNGCGVKAIPLGVENTTHWRDESGELEFFQHLHKFELPSDLEKSHQYCWEGFKLQHYQFDRRDYYEYGDPENTVAVKHRMVRTLTTGTTVSVLQRLVARRFIEQGRALCIWKTYTEGEGIFRGMHSNLTGWCCVRPLPDRPGTLGEACIRQFPVLFNGSALAANEFHQFLQTTLDEDKHEMMSSIHSSLHGNDAYV